MSERRLARGAGREERVDGRVPRRRRGQDRDLLPQDSFGFSDGPRVEGLGAVPGVPWSVELGTDGDVAPGGCREVWLHARGPKPDSPPR